MIFLIKHPVTFFKLIIILYTSSGSLYAQQLAFPGAEGFGSSSQGGRSGKVYHVENLNDNGPGSLRVAIEDTIPRTIIFRVSGTIELLSNLTIKSPYITIAGQTAPGDGICLKNFPLIISGTHDVIIRSIRVRPGIASGLPGNEIDAIGIYNSRNVIIDHCSASWSVDEILNTYHGNRDLTIQWCIFSEPLNNSIHPKGAHGYGASIGGYRASFHHNLFAHAPGRNPSVSGGTEGFSIFDFSNNVVFNWYHRSCDGKPVKMNFTGNYYKPGPATKDNVRRRLAKIEDATKYGYTSKWYINDNIIEGYPELSADNWSGAVDFDEGTSMKINRSMIPFENGGYKTREPIETYLEVLKYAGVRVPHRDEVDERIIAEVRSGIPSYGNGIIDKVEQVGGWPYLKTLPPPVDSDNDGMPDEWEVQNNLDPNNPDDRNGDFVGDGYTNLEKYMNSLMGK